MNNQNKKQNETKKNQHSENLDKPKSELECLQHKRTEVKDARGTNDGIEQIKGTEYHGIVETPEQGLCVTRNK